MPDYVIGYGSLIGPDHREKAGLGRWSEPVRLKGYRRAWNVKASNKKTYLGAVPSSSSVMNAVAFPVTGDQLRMLDGREGAYDRFEVEAEAIDARLDPQARIWLYVPKPEWTAEGSSPDFAVKRSYVDTVIEGCLAYGEAFCAEFIRTTELWEQYWFDNRKAPMEVRAKIDALVGGYYPPSRQVLTALPSRRHSPTV